MRQRHTGDGREMSESRSRLGLGLPSMDSRHQDSNGLDLYYNSRPPDSNWGYQPPPPVITEQPKSSMQHFQPYERNYPNTLESLAEKVHSFGLPGSRRMSAGGQPLPPRFVGLYCMSIALRCHPDSHFQIIITTKPLISLLCAAHRNGKQANHAPFRIRSALTPYGILRLYKYHPSG